MMQEYVFPMLMRQEYVYHVLMTLQEYPLCSDEAGISWRNAAVCVACVQKYTITLRRNSKSSKTARGMIYPGMLGLPAVGAGKIFAFFVIFAKPFPPFL
jgi:hypothetical protein